MYLSLLTQQSPIESQFINSLADNLNAEVCLGSVTSVAEACKWFTYTYLHVRMKSNPLTYKTLENDPGLELHRTELIKIAARQLDKVGSFGCSCDFCGLAKFLFSTERFASTRCPASATPPIWVDNASWLCYCFYYY